MGFHKKKFAYILENPNKQASTPCRPFNRRYHRECVWLYPVETSKLKVLSRIYVGIVD